MPNPAIVSGDTLVDIYDQVWPLDGAHVGPHPTEPTFVMINWQPVQLGTAYTGLAAAIAAGAALGGSGGGAGTGLTNTELRATPVNSTLTDGTNPAAIKAASTAAVAADPALVVAISPNNPIAPKRAGGSMFSGALAAGAQAPIAANATRTYIEVQNTHATEFIRVNLAGVASATDGFHLAPGQSYSSHASAVTTSAVSIFAFNAGATYAALEI